MIIQVSPQAEQRLARQLGDQPGFFKLFYDTDGCGSDGITVLLILNERDSDDVSIDAGSLPFVINKQQQIYFESCLRLQSANRLHLFQLSSNSKSYGNNIKVVDLRDSANVKSESSEWFVG
ncbi:iron-sulfur cluster biosynthesis family protein [Paenibacillus silvae]|uniref:iron-sulfur cluster biosynthesis family protein n=1 Tax=Paenibacillus silvae TaxID=1325358 RepID=UPI00200699C2|nr:iron-sulfur cluster biosynthesis family protein [Paenibacillus silvae]MCK6075120.1 iron-sulfur cluster biosynthesis family protein [Paenibacillus silvae]MCK6149506.1 iron-sulfur cluster biosynthesis family protein [Paenibacillus silvae]MCK6267805.1 iron-sulfur cluster biosynthesis family protein [Paenibacillus silvae]